VPQPTLCEGHDTRAEAIVLPNDRCVCAETADSDVLDCVSAVHWQKSWKRAMDPDKMAAGRCTVYLRICLELSREELKLVQGIVLRVKGRGRRHI